MIGKLIVKDLKIHKWNILMVQLMGMFLTIVNLWDEDAAGMTKSVLLYTACFAIITSWPILKVDKMAKNAMLNITLPVTRASIVWSRYILTLVMTTVFAILWLLLYDFSVQFLDGIPVTHDSLFQFKSFFMIFIATALYVSVAYPIYFMVGKIAAIITFIITMMASLVFMMKYWAIKLPTFQIYFTSDDLVQIVLLTLGAALLVIISALLSIYIYKNRDL